MRKILTTSLATAAVFAFTAGTAMAMGDCSGGKHQQSVKTDAPVTTAQIRWVCWKPLSLQPWRPW